MAVWHRGVRTVVAFVTRWRGTLPFVFLTLTLLVATVLAYQANDAARSHRNTVENTLRDYAGIATWEFTRRSRSVLEGAIGRTQRSVESAANRRGALPSPELVAVGLRSVGWDAHTFFRIDLPGPNVVVVDGKSSPTAMSWIKDSVLAFHEANTRRDWRLLASSGEVEGLNGEFVVHWVVNDRRDRSIAVYGFVTSAEAVGELFTSCSREELLPPTLARGQHTDSLLFVSVLAKDSVPIFQSPVRYETRFAATDTLGQSLGGLLIRASVRPDAAADLIIGGLPRSRVPLLLGLLILSLGAGMAALHQLRRERQLARLRDDFVSGVSHELRTPLAQIRMFGELLDGGLLRTVEERERSANVINREARRLTHLVENILHFSRLRRRVDPVHVHDTDVRTTIHETLESFGPLLRARKVNIATELSPGVIAATDPNALSQILINLLDNALKYGPEGQTIRISLSEQEGNAIIAIEDEGPGVPAAARSEIFDAYRRLDRDANTTIAGSGIGLAVVKQLSTLHGGSVWVEDGQVGARFVVMLPDAKVRTPQGANGNGVRAVV